MKFSTLMTIAAIIAFIFGILFILVPNVTLSFYGNKTDIVGTFLGRYLGAAYIGLAFLAWLNRGVSSKANQGGFFVVAALGFVVALYDALAGTRASGLVWLNVVIFLLLGVGFGYFTFGKKA